MVAKWGSAPAVMKVLRLVVWKVGYLVAQKVE